MPNSGDNLSLIPLTSLHNYLATQPYSELRPALRSMFDTNQWGARDGTVVRALASHQCGPGSYSGVDAICGLSLLLVLSLAQRGFSPGTPVFPLLQIEHFQIPIRPGIR